MQSLAANGDRLIRPEEVGSKEWGRFRGSWGREQKDLYLGWEA